jgi:predicted aspartyl protease
MSRSLPLRIYRNFLIVAEGQIGGVSERQNFVLDTGTAPSIIDTRLARKLGSETTSSIMTVFGRTISTQSAIIREIELGLIHAVSLYVQVEDLSGFEREIGIPIAAIIGLDVLSKSSFRLDYDKKQIEFGDVSDSGIAVPFDERTGTAVARVSLEGKPMRLLVDTGSDKVALLGGNLADTERLGIRSTTQRGSGLADHNAPVRVLLAPDVVLEGQHFTPEKVYFIPGSADPAFDGILGVRALGFRAVAYDQARAAIYLQR